MTPTFGSLFAGVGGFDLGFEAAGYTCGFQVEWDKHCQQVLAHRWPDVPRWGDVSEVSGYDLPPVDVITYGFPCQDLSVAGKRAGLDGDRSNLFFQAIRIIKEMREATNGMAPTFAVAENVAGLLNADKGDAMARVLDTLAEAGAVGIEWCLLDAQWFGVPQRRRRVFVTACFDSATFARCPNPLFPVAESGARNPAEIDQEKQEVASTLGGGSGSRGWSPDTDRMTSVPFAESAIPMQDGTKFQSQNGVGVGKPGDPMYTLTSVEEHAVGVPETFRMLGFGHYEEDNSASALKARDHKDATDLVAFVKSRRAQTSEDAETWIEDAPAPTLNQFDTGDSRATVISVEPTVVGPLTTGSPGRIRGTETTDSGHIVATEPTYVADTSGCLMARDHKDINTDGLDSKLIVNEPIVFDPSRRDGARPQLDGTSNTLTSHMGTGGNNTPMVAEPVYSFDSAFGSQAGIFEDISPPVKIGSNSGGNPPAISQQYNVRRLTPTECERLMGWPDDHTLHRADGKPASDSQRYKQCGNGVVAPVAQWIAKHLKNALCPPTS